MRRTAGPPPLKETTFDLTPEQRYHGARAVASAANDADDCALLLAVLGLEPADGIADPPPLPPRPGG
ncbi:hypothetical protein [Amycolatopsis sp. DG1A-15b]|uniref:hypothetical protein n=1 Tax=Amycolatopsis sp. DG1A-15b TaxID=3052846 RepID=UPI00255C2210|nr:hypothetical protein [Amycolatopsis sp. DG1A-15b]WIX85215.1 hypothetical protein QRY02_28730 [Amycolatopsis sp. DG1A-15b]